MTDLSKIFDSVKLRFYYEWMVNTHVHDEGDSQMHKSLTEQVVKTYIDPMELPKDAVILDLGCGPGYFLDEMTERGYTNLTGVTLSPGDIELCQSKGHNIKQYDLSFLPQSDGWNDESVDFIFLRHALEHSPFPLFSLVEYNRVLKYGAKMYIEVPAPDCSRGHEHNPNHYSILGSTQLAALLRRTGFDINVFNNFEFDVTIPKSTNDEQDVVHKEHFYSIIVTKAKSLDIK